MKHNKSMLFLLLIAVIIPIFLVVRLTPNSFIHPKNIARVTTYEFKTGKPAKQFDDSDWFAIIFNNKDVLITWDARKSEALKSANGREMISLNIDKDFYIEKLQYTKYSNNLLILCEESDSESGTGDVFLINGDNLKTLLKNRITGFNVGEPVIKGRYIYVSAICFIGKIDLETGNYVWKHELNYNDNPHRYNAFNKPEFSGSNVIFNDTDRSNPKDGIVPFGFIKVDDESGKILEMK